MELSALGYSRCGPSVPTYLSDFRWGRLNFDTDAAAVERTDGPRRLFSSGEAEGRARQEIAVQDEH